MPRCWSSRRLRRGSIYVVVLMAAMIIGVIGVAALARSRVEFATSRDSRDFQQARLLARSAIEIGVENIAATPTWRSWAPGLWLNRSGVAGGAFTLYGSDPVDGNLNNNTSDPVRLIGVGRVGSTAFGWQADFQSVDEPLAALRSAVHAGSTLEVKNNRVLTVNGAPATTNANLIISGSVVGAVEGMSISGGGSVSDGIRVPTTPRAAAPAGIVAAYAARGTTIPFSFGGDTMQQAVLTRALNPWGKPDKNGVYVINTGGKNMTIKKMRIEGTLVILAPGKTVSIEELINIRNYTPTYPAIIVDGSIVLKLKSQTSISELSVGVNFNPPGAPYGGSTDSDLLDFYPTEITGFIHATEDIIVNEPSTVNGSLLAGNLVTIGLDNLTVNYNADIQIEPPEGYVAPGPLRPVGGSWVRVETLP